MECKKELNEKDCACEHASCPRHGVCCDCVKYHKTRKEIPCCLR